MSEEANQKLQQQLFDLQSQLAYQEDTLQALNSVVAEQDKIIRRLVQKMQQMDERLHNLSQSLPASDVDSDEVPPHY